MPKQSPISVREALRLIPDSEFVQPEGKWVADAYEDGLLQDHTTCLYLLAYLLHRLNNLDTVQARLPEGDRDAPVQIIIDHT
jgi:hypothetical protein